MSVDIIFETHSWSEDNERGIATGWLPGRLSERGRAAAAELGGRRRSNAIAAVFTSDLARAAETAAIAFGDRGIPIIQDERLLVNCKLSCYLAISPHRRNRGCPNDYLPETTTRRC